MKRKNPAVTVFYTCFRWTDTVSQWTYSQKQCPCALREVSERGDRVYKAGMFEQYWWSFAPHKGNDWHPHHHNSSQRWTGELEWVATPSVPSSRFRRLQCLRSKYILSHYVRVSRRQEDWKYCELPPEVSLALTFRDCSICRTTNGFQAAVWGLTIKDSKIYLDTFLLQL